LGVGGKRIASSTIRHPEAWASQVQTGAHGLERWEEVTDEEQSAEALLMGLRLAEGVDIAPIEQKRGRPLSHVATLESQGLVTLTFGRLRATPRGRLVLNAVLRQLSDVGAALQNAQR
jgi:oxygen-independent coproporphyrinogen-3 oxidase